MELIFTIIMVLWWNIGDDTDDKLLRYTLRVDRVYFKKFRYITEYEGRSANKDIEQYIKRRVIKFEEVHGKIEFHEDE